MTILLFPACPPFDPVGRKKTAQTVPWAVFGAMLFVWLPLPGAVTCYAGRTRSAVGQVRQGLTAVFARLHLPFLHFRRISGGDCIQYRRDIIRGSNGQCIDGDGTIWASKTDYGSHAGAAEGAGQRRKRRGV